MGMGGMASTVVGGSTHVLDLLPTWLGIAVTLVFLSVMSSHVSHAASSTGTRRLWHCVHVLMALSMAVMFLPSSILRIGISASAWQALFTITIVMLLAGGAFQVMSRRAPSALWLLVVLDMVAMVYMWAPASYSAPVSWLAAVYLIGESLLWAGERIGVIDRPIVGGGYALSGGGVIGVVRALPLTCARDLRLSMVTMTLGMAYMIVAMQLMG